MNRQSQPQTNEAWKDLAMPYWNRSAFAAIFQKPVLWFVHCGYFSYLSPSLGSETLEGILSGTYAYVENAIDQDTGQRHQSREQNVPESLDT